MQDTSGSVTSTYATNVIATSGNIGLRSPPNAIALLAPAGAVTGVTMDVGTAEGQTVYVMNNSAFSVTFAAAGTSHVADGVSDVIAAQTGRGFVWSILGGSLWYRLG